MQMESWPGSKKSFNNPFTYSVLSDLAGLALAARIAWKHRVIDARVKIRKAAKAKIVQLIFIR